MTEPRRNRWRWIFWVLAIAILGGLAYWATPHLMINTGHHPPGMRVVRNAAYGLESFKCDWGVYPPSSSRTGGAREFGYQCLAIYLLGPAGNGTRVRGNAFAAANSAGSSRGGNARFSGANTSSTLSDGSSVRSICTVPASPFRYTGAIISLPMGSQHSGSPLAVTENV